MKPKIYFVSGQSRSGSELLVNILAQNPRFNVTTTSGIINILAMVKNSWNDIEEFKATPNEEGKKRVLKSILYSYYDNDKINFDKSRGWCANLEMAKEILDNDIKVLAPVRDMRDVLASWEKLYRNNIGLAQSTVEKFDYFKAQTVQGRCEILLKDAQPVGISHNRMIDAIQRGWGKHIFFIDYEDLTTNPEKTMKEVYVFLGEEYFNHNFDNIVQVTQSNDSVYGFKDLHTIKPKVEFQSNWMEILGNWAKEYEKYNFWRKRK